jgi:hypothetical protein
MKKEVSMSDTIIVFTRRPAEEIVNTGGSQAWRIKRDNARKAKYLVCTRNARDSSGKEPHRAGFLVGRISDIVLAPNQSGNSEGRYLIRIDGWKGIDLPDLWTFGRNPIHYANIADLGIDPESIDFDPMPKPEVNGRHSALPEPNENSMTAANVLAETKRHLAQVFGVDPSAIEITVRA